MYYNRKPFIKWDQELQEVKWLANVSDISTQEMWNEPFQQVADAVKAAIAIAES